MIKHLLLDLDNTLYPASGGMDAGISSRMQQFVANFLEIPLKEAIEQRAKNVVNYGTTLEWLKLQHGLKDAQAYFDAVHPENELDELQKDTELRPYLLSLELPMTLLTNAPMSHAARVLSFFNISDVFLGVFDLTYHDGKGKPHPESFLNTLQAVGKTVKESLFVDDHPKYVRGYKALGGSAVIVDEQNRHETLAQKEGFGHIKSIYELKGWLTKQKANPR
ncbi:MAG TPA: HAD-IA family hydrolase [Treponema sp.]|nr:HAD-IA family hydrolase [Treponema sp.]